MINIETVKKFTFDSAHYLPGYNGKCQNLHGHTYILEVGIYGKIDEKTGMVIDFGELKNIVKENIIDELDHKLINDIISMPTAENMVVWIHEKLEGVMKTHRGFGEIIRLSLIRLWETQTSYAEWRNLYYA